MNFRQWTGALCLALGLLASQSASAKDLNIVTDIAPVQALLRDLTAGVQSPVQLIPANVSGHDFALKPSQVRALQKADLIVWMGPQATPGLAKLMTQPEFAAKSIDLNAVDSITRHPLRQAGLIAAQEQTSALSDPHSWLDPENALIWIEDIATQLSATDPENTVRYQAAHDDLKDEITTTSSTIRTLLARIDPVPYIQFHDAFQYFEHRFGLAPIGVVAVDDEESASLGVLSSLRRALSDQKTSCVFVFNEHQTDLAHPLLELPGVRTGILNPLGNGDLRYPQFLLEIATSYEKCLASPS